MSSLTTEVFPNSRAGYYRVYYTVTKSQDVEAALAKRHPVVLMLWASWNEPCRVMLKSFRDMAMAKRKEAVFCPVDVDSCKDVVERFRVEALPTFLLINECLEMARVVGIKVDELKTKIKMNRQWMYGDRRTSEYIMGLQNFIVVANANRGHNGFMCRPCVHCQNKKDYSNTRTIHALANARAFS